MKFLIAFLILWTSLVPALSADGPPEDIDNVQTSYEQTLKSDPRNLEALFTLGLIYEKKQRRQDALKMWKQYLALETDVDHRRIAQKHIHQLSQ